MSAQRLSRRDLLRGSVAFAALAFAQRPLSVFGFDEAGADETVVPFLDMQPKGKMLYWQDLTSWITPNDQLYSVSHYGTPEVDPAKWQLEISGLVKQPRALSFAQIKARKRKTVTATLECSGNSSNPGFMGAIGNIEWTGTPLASLLEECHPLDRASEAVFFGADEKVEKIRDKDYLQNFARSLSLRDALKRDDVLLAYEMNGQPLEKDHIWRETSVGPMDVKSVVARVLRRKDGSLRVTGAAWTDGTPLQRVELKVDNGKWASVELDKTRRSKYSWTFWSYDWKNPTAGDHTLVSRALDAEGRVQPSGDDPEIKLKRTYWEANQQWVRKIRI